MTSETDYKIGNQTRRLLAIFYFAVGIALLGYFAFENSTSPPHILVLGLLSLFAGYTIIVPRKWTIPIIVGLFFVGITFGITTLFHSVMLQSFVDALLLHLSLIIYMILLVIVSVYIISRRENFD